MPRSMHCLIILLLAALLCGVPALAQETDGDCLYTLLDEQGQVITMRGGRMYEGDEYIAGDNRYYRIVSVNDDEQTATAEYLGMAEVDQAALAAFYGSASAEEKSEDASNAQKDDSKKLICMYSTHSDESYVPDDGESSLWENAGIYDVGNSLKEELEKQGIQVIYSEESFLPHDAGAYDRSRSTAEELLKKVQEMGVKVGYVTLHVGLGTFRPVKEDEITDHTMHSEYCVIPQETADLINETKKNGGRVICVGTTSCRTIESQAAEDGTMRASAGWTDIFIYPGYKFKVLDALVTNFHLPESTLIMLVSALAGREHVLAAYQQAVEERYRFFSFGDAMFIQ